VSTTVVAKIIMSISVNKQEIGSLYAAPHSSQTHPSVEVEIEKYDGGCERCTSHSVSWRATQP